MRDIIQKIIEHNLIAKLYTLLDLPPFGLVLPSSIMELSLRVTFPLFQLV